MRPLRPISACGTAAAALGAAPFWPLAPRPPTALPSVIGLPNAQARKSAGTWLSFPTANSALAQLVSGLLNAQVASELHMSGPYSYGKAATVDGQHALALRGTVSTQSGSKVPV